MSKQLAKKLDRAELRILELRTANASLAESLKKAKAVVVEGVRSALAAAEREKALAEKVKELSDLIRCDKYDGSALAQMYLAQCESERNSPAYRTIEIKLSQAAERERVLTERVKELLKTLAGESEALTHSAAKLAASSAREAEILSYARHTHEARYYKNDDGKMVLTDACNRCGMDLRHDIHSPLGLNAPSGSIPSEKCTWPSTPHIGHECEHDRAKAADQEKKPWGWPGNQTGEQENDR